MQLTEEIKKLLNKTALLVDVLIQISVLSRLASGLNVRDSGVDTLVYHYNKLLSQSGRQPRSQGFTLRTKLSGTGTEYAKSAGYFVLRCTYT